MRYRLSLTLCLVLAALAPAPTLLWAANPGDSPAAAKPDSTTETPGRFSLTVADLPDGWEKKIPSPDEAVRLKLAATVKELREGSSFHDADLAFLRRHRAAAVSALRTELKADWQKSPEIFEALLNLGDAETRARWYAAFSEADTDQRDELLALTVYDEAGKDMLESRTPEEEAAIRKALSGQKPMLRVVYYLAKREGVATLLLDRLEDFPATDRFRVVEAAIEDGAPTPADLGRALAWVRTGAAKGDSVPEFMGLAAKLMAHRETAKDAAELFAELFAHQPDLGFGTQSILVDFTAHATAASRPLIEKLSRESNDAHVRSRAYAALARLGGAEFLPALEKLALDPKTAGDSWAALAELARSGSREKVDAIVLRTPASQHEHVAVYALEFGSPEALKHALALKDMHPERRVALRWKSDSLTAKTFLARLLERKLIQRLPSDAELAKLNPPGDEPLAEHALAFGALDLLGVSLNFDAEADYLPPPYEKLFRQFSDLTNGAFAPRDFRQKPLKPSKKSKRPARDLDEDEEEEEDDSGNQIEFSAGGKRFTLRVPPLGDWYDVGAVEATVNRALAEGGHRERVLALQGWGQTAQFVYGLPEAWQEVAREFHLPLGPSSAVEQGKEFERRVLEKLKKDGR